MIYTPMTVKAMKLAYRAHLGQVDHNNVPYIFHPYHVAEQMTDEISCTVALLHDVVEDTEVTLEDLGREFPPEVVEAVALLTHDKTVDYSEYVKEVKKNPIAKRVKLADLAHNSDESRFAGSEHTAEQLAYWRQKYSKAKAILLE
ncbi:MAG: bifunctional (p)ppGpp synthetase/guanosine-3',5'-bis(diphosphate) 3'-pyrophosphohydrolase [Lachnospiraceae bacterium]|nr:bifunctional (p)ppGpp synthetase/guanosine-3',5'-bis(diphosphate) 3'-pyrophosphohydrolase [Lachnospiraceae bacterium]MBQ2401594.1 bifunctional (p)ppGpp synthetase/guanosine-3',5'-bis(diphosphate) 3'-pyrophosphohydrolase [Lachnospiraceae bacterium]MBQ5660664.1 bifunctional (p)ppGpp synthetase/guanosine-3',5'-bis(diphosphate) 3'-pyrophosphohydrolase [Lachnospiraceae bacterium]MBR0305740.1 bifunctional (p)ppGpp synthetase/guanosine-3',5'-bis(diphosphate) 3'-pyrophosphohydrolase [Lachnospiraceae 